MASINLPSGTWVDLYAAGGVTAGQKLGFTNSGPYNVYVVVSQTNPGTTPQGNGNPSGYTVEYPAGTQGVWAYCFHDNPATVGASAAASSAGASAALSAVTASGAAAPLFATGGALNVESGAGQHTYGYTNGVLTTDQWLYNGVTRTKTYTYTNGVLAGESDWV